MTRRETELMRTIEREETEAQRRIQAGFAEVERRQIEHLQRFLERAAGSVSEDATRQFEEARKAAREDAARRLGRELARAVEMFSRQAQTLLVDRMGVLSEGAEQRLDKRLNQTLEEITGRSNQAWGVLDKRVGDFELELRARLDTLGAEIDSKRQALEARLLDLRHHLDEALEYLPPADESER